jgi:hypothetical protein
MLSSNILDAQILALFHLPVFWHNGNIGSEVAVDSSITITKKFC